MVFFCGKWQQMFIYLNVRLLIRSPDRFPSYYEAGFGWGWSLLTSLTVYTGAFQFVLVTFLSSGASFLTIALTALFMNSRQFFYGITFVEDFKQMDAGAGKNKLIAVAVCAGLHLWKKNTLLSIIGSTAVYMILVVVCP